MVAPYVNPLIDLRPMFDAIRDNERSDLAKQEAAHAAERLGFERQRFAHENKLFPLRERTMTSAADRADLETQWMKDDRPDAVRARQLELEGKGVGLDAARENLRHGREIHPKQVDLMQAQIDAARQKPGFKTEVINGKVIGIAPDGTTRVLHDGGPDFSKLPEFAAKSAAFATRMIDAERNVRDIMAKPADPKKPDGPKVFDPTSAYTAIQRMAPEGISNYMMRSGEHQQYQQAAEQWIRAFLRKESGAAIGKDEFARDFKVYFPQPGDTKDVIAQKEQARLRAVQGFVGETRDFHKHVDPRGHDTLNEWLNPKVTKQFTDRHTPGAAGTPPPGGSPANSPTARDALIKAAGEKAAEWDKSNRSPEEIKQGKVKIMEELRRRLAASEQDVR